MVEKRLARYVYPISTNAQTKNTTDLGYGLRRGEPTAAKHIETDGYVLDYLELTPEAEEAVKAEAASWLLQDQYFYSYENDDYGTCSSDEGVRYYEIADMTSISSPVYSGFRGDMLVIDGHFAGVVIETERSGGNGWSGNHVRTYGILFTDGTVLGNNQKNESFSGESTSRESSSCYHLKKKTDIPQS